MRSYLWTSMMLMREGDGAGRAFAHFTLGSAAWVLTSRPECPTRHHVPLRFRPEADSPTRLDAVMTNCNPHPTIRRATPEDAPTLAALGAATFTEAFGHLYPPEDLQAFLSRMCAVWVAVLADSTSIGFSVRVSWISDSNGLRRKAERPCTSVCGRRILALNASMAATDSTKSASMDFRSARP